LTFTTGRKVTQYKHNSGAAPTAELKTVRSNATMAAKKVRQGNIRQEFGKLPDLPQS